MVKDLDTAVLRSRLRDQAKVFAQSFESVAHPALLGVTDGKAVGTYIETAFKLALHAVGVIDPLEGNAAKGIDLPTLGVDIKVTSAKQPQSSSPFENFKQKIEGFAHRRFSDDARTTTTHRRRRRERRRRLRLPRRAQHPSGRNCSLFLCAFACSQPTSTGLLDDLKRAPVAFAVHPRGRGRRRGCLRARVRNLNGRPGVEWGDFQTPRELAARVWTVAARADADVVVEPTVGRGAFLETAPLSMRAARWCAFDLNPEHVAQARRAAVAAGLDARIEVLDVFHLSGETIGNGLTNASVLVIGNPPWVTAAAQGARGATNLPSRNGGHGLSGLDSITGRSNFDTGEAVVLRVLSALIAAREVHLAVLVKRTVAMKLAKRFLGLPGVSAATFSTIDARRFFGASVDAGLFQLSIRKAKAATTTKIRLVSEIGSKEERLGEIIGGRVITDMVAYRSVRHLEADATYRFDWRQGIKHDCSRVLELIPTDAGIVNGLGEPVDVEPEVLCPLYKCSDLAAGRAPSRLFPLYQTDLTGPFHDLGERWPRLARYLEEHVDLFRVRRSRIYEGKPDFTLFGVGDYSLAPFKVAVSGLHKQPRFRVVGPGANGAPPLVDDTSYTLACSSLTEAEEAAAYLNGDTALAFLCEIADPLAKRPFTKDVLTRLRPPGAPAQLFVPAA